MSSLSPPPKLQFFANNGTPLVGGKLYSYAAGTTTPLATYSSSSLTTPNTNPVILDSRGEAGVWLGVQSYKLALYTPDNILIWTVDNIEPSATQQDLAAAIAAAIASLTTTINTRFDNLASTSSNTQGDALIGFRQSNSAGFLAGATGQTVSDKLRNVVSVTDFGAVPDGATSANAAFDAMAAAYGFVVFPAGDFLLNTRFIDVPMYFNAGAAITVATGNTVRIRSRITASPKQQIFKGAGDIFFENDNALGIGEDSRHAYAAWWGIFPVGQAVTVQTALFTKALSAYTSQNREGIFELDIGSYLIDGPITIPRGVHFKGAGTRRTIIDLRGNNYTALQSGGAAVKITGIQFEQQVGTEAYFNGTQIALLHDTPVVEDVRLWNAKVGVYANSDATRAYISQVVGIYGQEPGGGYPSDSALVWVQATNCLVEDVQVTNTVYGPNSAVLVGFGHTSAMNNTIINDVGVSEKTIPVKIIADTNNISNTVVNSAVFFGSTGDNIPAVVEASTSGSADLLGLSMNNLCANSLAAALLKMTQASSGSTVAVTLGSGSAFSSATNAANLTRTAGTMTRIVIAHGVAAWSATPPVVTSGTITNLEIASYM